jgi:hypothetical protein
VEYEFSVEKGCTTVDEDIEAVLAAHPAEKTIFLSDFYWPSDLLRRLLHEKGLGGVVTDGISSCDIGLNKRSGRLFRHVMEAHGVKPSGVVHIGDNPHSDVAAAQAHGIQAVHFQPKAGHESRLKREALFSRRESLFVDAAERARAACKAHLGVGDTDQAVAFRAGAEMAPLFVGFSLFVAENAVSHRVERLFFLMREGDFLKRVFEAVHVDGTLRGHALPPASLLAVSRVSTAFAGVDDPVAEIFKGHCWPYRGHQLASLVDAIGLEGECVDAALEEMHLHKTDVIADVVRDHRLRRFLSRPDIRRQAAEACAMKREYLLRYLQSQGFLENGRYAAVDIGWRGTIQANICRLGVAAKVNGYYLALQRPLGAAPNTCDKEAYLIDEAKSADYLDLLDTYGAMEMLCAAPVGSTTHYEQQGGSIVPVRAATNAECSYSESVIPHFQDGVVYGCRIWAPLVVQYGCSASDLVPSSVRAWYRLLQSPPRVIVSAFAKTVLDDPYAANRFLRPKDVPTIRRLAAACLDKGAFIEIQAYLRRVRWSRAVAPTSPSTYIRSRIFSGLLTLASWYRRVKRKLRRS